MRIHSMATSEQAIQQQIRLACSRGPVRLWRNNVGTGWTGDATKVTPENMWLVVQRLRPGDVVIREGRPLHAGLCEGSSDLIGYTTVTITPEMVGQRLAVFTAIEVKAERGRPTAGQTAFLNHISSAGGRSGIARSDGDAHRILGVSM
jgi:hypothetical protein